MAKKKWNYAVVQSVFGNLWIGKTKLPVEKDRIFDSIADAIHKATILFEHNHLDFNPVDEDNNSMELQDQYDTLTEATEDETEIIIKGVERFIK